MPRSLTKPKTELSKAVTELRTRSGQTQQELASMLGIALATVARYETFRPPKGEALVRFAALAKEKEFDDLAERFQAAIDASSLYLLFQTAAQQIEETATADQVELSLAALLADSSKQSKLKALLKKEIASVQNLGKTLEADANLRAAERAARQAGKTEEADRLAWEIMKGVKKFNESPLSKIWRRTRTIEPTDIKW